MRKIEQLYQKRIWQYVLDLGGLAEQIGTTEDPKRKEELKREYEQTQDMLELAMEDLKEIE